MATDYHDVVALLESESLAGVESAIAEGTHNTISRDHLRILANYTQAEISLSGLTVDQISAMLLEHRDSLIDFGVAFLHDEEATDDTQEYPEGEEPDPDDVDRTVEERGLGIGFGITYAIYWYFLTNHTAKDFTDFLKKRRIPGARKFATELRRIYAALNE